MLTLSSADPDTDDPDKPVQVGTVQVLRARVYTLDPDHDVADLHNASAVVAPGTYPVYRAAGRVWWVMTGRVNEIGTIRPLPHPGMFTMVTADVPGEQEVAVESARLDAAGLAALLAEPLCAEGHPAQRLRFRPPRVAAGRPDTTAPPTRRSARVIDDMYRTAYRLLHTRPGHSDEFRRGVVETIAGTLGLDGPLGKRAVAERLGLDPAALYPPDEQTTREDDGPYGDGPREDG